MNKAPVNYYGGKGGQLNHILSAFPVDGWDKYLEPYGGSGVVLLNKPKVDIEVWNDLNDELFALYTVLSQNHTFKRFIERCHLTPYHEKIRSVIKASKPTDIVDIAFRFWYLNRTSYNGIGGFKCNLHVRRHMPKSISDYLSSIDGLEGFFNRWSTVQVFSRNALPLIKKYDREGWLFYLDPPYVQSTRKSNARYKVDQKDDHHIELVGILKELKHAKVCLSGYDNDIYKALNWNTTQYTAPNSSSIETLWMNY